MGNRTTLRAGTRNSEYRKKTELILDMTNWALYKSLKFKRSTQVVADAVKCRSTGVLSCVIRETKNAELGYSFSAVKTCKKRFQARIPLPWLVPSFRLGSLDIQQRGQSLIVHIPRFQRIYPTTQNAQHELNFCAAGVL